VIRFVEQSIEEAKQEHVSVCRCLTSSRHDLAIHGGLMLAMLAVGYLALIFRPTRIDPPNIPPPDTQAMSGGENGGFGSVSLPDRYDAIARSGVFDTIIPKPSPTTPPEPPPPPPPRIEYMMSQLALFTIDLPNGVTLLNTQTRDLIPWKVGERRTVRFQGARLDVTLRSVDGNELRAAFTAPDNQTHVYSYFGEGPR